MNDFRYTKKGDIYICKISKSKHFSKGGKYIVLEVNPGLYSNYITIKNDCGKKVFIDYRSHSKFEIETDLNLSYSDAIALINYCKNEVKLFGESAYKSDVAKYYNKCIDILEAQVLKKLKSILNNNLT